MMELEKFEIRYIRQEESMEAAMVEQACFPPHEACSVEQMLRRAKVAPELFMVAVDRASGEIAGFLNGLATNKTVFSDDFFSDVDLYEPLGTHVMLLGLAVLPKYQHQGLAKVLMQTYCCHEKARGRQKLVLTCLDEKVSMYEKMGFCDCGLSSSVWGGEQWHYMLYDEDNSCVGNE